MMARRHFIARSTAGTVLAAHSHAWAQERATTGPKTGYAPLDGLSLYYEIHGSGEPLMLFDGGALGIVMFGPNVAALAKNRAQARGRLNALQTRWMVSRGAGGNVADGPVCRGNDEAVAAEPSVPERELGGVIHQAGRAP
jgi:hypothetical protein